MERHLQKEIEKLKKKILSLGAMVEERVRMAIQARETRNGDLATKIIDADREIDEIEVEIEEECLKVLALHQPVAVDLRFISAVIKINNDLERIGDEAVNIAERVINISKRPPVTVPFDFSVMAEKTEAMLKGSLDALVNLDVDLAYKICLLDDEVDEINHSIYDKIKEAISRQPDRVGYLINLLLISRHLERIADHATNIAEEVIYMIEGEISRHRMDEFNPDRAKP
ncbi:MAG: phosphate signaling complex protein PhoU [Deltaproteobacteria bacterium]|nr:phosphate signaling complex protein PhoU [Deltaproteobacteria bacterium]MBW1738180.1 phosphate signaling complex protein PhoU [Deltaproteobacteria bacterium]MBW2033748.1 phosphate signaling complex protein PhoU [Deltaproteobacteria bacterium]MBW2114636.1 phosphate signaling complex protein PhoU [Deltaproteobacteria bacterium]MBW2358464.1 phosphate signaling complex protein PhoU [Deltaproteobacteria bacterium]